MRFYWVGPGARGGGWWNLLFPASVFADFFLFFVRIGIYFYSLSLFLSYSHTQTHSAAIKRARTKQTVV